MIQAVVDSYDSKLKTVNVWTCEPRPIKLKHVRVQTLFTGDTIVSIPMKKGTAGLVAFIDENQQFVFKGNIQQTEMFEGGITAVFFPGFNSFAQDFDVPDGVYLKHGETEILVKTDGTVSIKNSTADLLKEVVSLVEQLVLATDPVQYISAAPGSPCAPAPTRAAMMLAIDTLKDKIDSFNS